MSETHEFPTPEVQQAAIDSNPRMFWNKLAGVTTHTATPSEEAFDNVKANIGRPLPWFHNSYPVPEAVLTATSRKINLIGGGPSIKDTAKELPHDEITVACGSVHDWLQENWGAPTYCTIVDPDPIMAAYLTKPHHDTTYLVASQCAATVFDALAGYNVVMFHSWPIAGGDVAAKDFLQEHTPNWIAVGGGCTIGLRSISIAMMMGYSDIHFWGFDSCLGTSDDEHHAYNFTDETKEFLGDIYELRFGLEDGPGSRVYRVAGYQLAQADHYKQMYQTLNHLFRPTFHGPGLLADVQALIDSEIKRLEGIAV